MISSSVTGRISGADGLPRAAESVVGPLLLLLLLLLLLQIRLRFCCLYQMRRMRTGQSPEIVHDAMNTMHFSSTRPKPSSPQQRLCIHQLVVCNRSRRLCVHLSKCYIISLREDRCRKHLGISHVDGKEERQVTSKGDEACGRYVPAEPAHLTPKIGSDSRGTCTHCVMRLTGAASACISGDAAAAAAGANTFNSTGTSTPSCAACVTRA